MKLGLRSLAATTAGALAAALTIGTASPAVAQIDTSSIGEEEADALFSAAGSLPLGSTTELLTAFGSADLPLGPGSSSPLYGVVRPVDESINTAQFIEVVETDGVYEKWLVHSAAMQREVILEVVPAEGDAPAPVLYLLDGVDSPDGHTGWSIHDKLGDDNVHLVAPTGAYASFFSDWEKEDPNLGNHKWETFLTDELPGIYAEGLAERDELAGMTDKAGIAGISMGAQAAMHLAATHPEIYDGVMSFSGYYSTMDPLGYQTIRLTVETRGGDMDNMWGPHGSERWLHHDTIAHPEGLENSKVYFSAGNGEFLPEDMAPYKDDDIQGMFLGILLERGVYEGTKDFERVLKREGIDHKVVYTETGVHNWYNFMKTFDQGWDYIRPALFG